MSSPHTADFELGPKQRAWVDALRSGSYEQGESFLCAGGAYCCLGVAADLSGALESPDDGGTRVIAVGPDSYITGHLDRLTVDAYGLRSEFGNYLPRTLEVEDYRAIRETLEPHNAGIDQLAGLNDAGVPFAVIADLLERFPQAWLKEPK